MRSARDYVWNDGIVVAARRQTDQHNTAACRTAHKLITESRASFVRDEVSSVSDSPRLLWRTVRRLLHPAANISCYDGMDTAVLVSGFSNFFVDKVQRVKAAIDAGLRSSHLSTCPLSSAPAEILSSFSPVTVVEVERLIRATPTKTSPLDALPISLLKQCGAE